MKKLVYKFKGRQRVFFGFLCVCLLTSISFLINHKTQAEAESQSLQTASNNNSLKSFKPQGETLPTVNVGERASVWLKLEPGKSLDTTFHGSDSAISALQGNLAEPTSQVSADINADGYADLISGFRNADGGGLIALHRASKEAFEPQNERVLADLRRGVFPATFEKDALILDVPTAPDFIFAGRFSKDSALDLVFASRGGNSIYLMTSDGNGGFNPAREITLDGEITALAADSLDASKIYSGLIVGLRGGKSSIISVFDGTAELVNTTPRNFQMEGDVNSLILANPGGTAQGKDVFGLANGEIFTMRRIGSSNSSIHKIELPFRAVDIAVGEFIRDRAGRAEIAVLSEDGNVSYLTRGTLDTRPFTTEEVLQSWRQNGGRGREIPVSKSANNLSDDWAVAESQQLGVYSSGGNSARVLQKAYLTGNETDDLLVTDSQNNRVQILFKEPNTDKNRTSFTSETKFQNVDFAVSPAAVLPMRLNVMGQQGFVFFSKGSLEPIPVIAAPSATFTVTTTTDENNGACSAAGTGCSVREAINAANGAAGADMITFTPNGTHQLTIDLAGVENAGAEGDLDVTQALTIVGNGTANTILQAGTTTANGIDKVLSFNPNFNAAFASSISGVTVRFGRNPSTFATDGFGGGFDWEGSGTGTLNVSGSVVTDNRTTDGDGGGITATNSSPGAGGFTASTTTISNNMPARAGANSPLGGGIFVGQTTSYFLTNVTINNNNVSGSGGMGEGGGIFAFGPTSASSNSFLTGSTVTNNSAPIDGGGIRTTQRLDINPLTTISNNSAGRFGGGIFINQSNITSTFSKLTMVGNSATTNGGAIYLGSSATANVLSVSFSRIVGNTGGGFRGLAVDAGTANVENNWWGCNTGPSAAPCDTAGVVGTGTVDFNPWLRYTHTASPSSIVVGQTSTLTASFLTNSAGTAIAASNLDVLIGLPITFNTPVRGTISAAQATIQASGTATATFTATSAGAGSANAAVDSGTATANITIGMANTTTTITSDNPEPSVFGATITVAYTVAPQFSGTPTGNVVVTISGGTETCMGTVAAGQCTLALTNLGARTLTATYSGDTNFNGGSDTEPHQVNKANTQLSGATDAPDPSVVGQPYTTGFTLSVVAPGAGTPTGMVTVTDGTGGMCSATLPAMSCSLTSTTAGVKTLTFSYGGDANFNASPNLTAGHLVNKANTTTTINSNTPNPSNVNTAVTVTYSVAVNSPGAGTPTGTVTVSDGVNSCMATVAAGSCMITLTTSGMRTLTATYGSDANFTGSVSNGVSQTVMPVLAASVEVSGQVLTQSGRGISSARVIITDQSGDSRTVMTSSFGYFRFTEVQAGETYIISVVSKRYHFAPQVLNITEELTNLNFTAQ